MAVDENLRQYATERQAQLLDAIKEAGTVAGGAKLLGINQRNAFDQLQRLKKKAALAGYSPEHNMTRTVPDGFGVNRVSSLYNKDGELTAQWVIGTADRQRQAELMREAIEALKEDLPQVEPRKPTGEFNSALMAGYPIGDAHIGMRAWGEECGEDFDLAIAERRQCAAMADLVDRAPACEKAVIVNLGDFLHYDSMEAVTSRSGHILDADGRYAKMVRVAVKVIRQCIESALTKHKTVRVINVIGNHDDTGAIWLSASLAHIYENEPRVTVDTSPAPFMYVRHGKVLIGCHHGHTCKADKLAGVMANDRAEDWGQTAYRYWWTGHIHHDSVKEYPGVKVESFRTLAPKDAYATWGGWRSQQDMKCIVLHSEYGEVARHTVNPDMLRAA